VRCGERLIGANAQQNGLIEQDLRCSRTLNGDMTLAQLIAAYEAAVHRLNEATKIAHTAGYGHEFTTAYEQASTNRLEVLFELFSFEPATKDDADRLLQFISDNLEAFRTWLTIADDDERASFFGRLAKAILHGRAAPEYDR